MTATTSGHITVLNPTAPPRELRTAMAERPADLRGKAVGFLWNSKPNGDVLFQRLEQLLREKYEIPAMPSTAANPPHPSRPNLGHRGAGRRSGGSRRGPGRLRFLHLVEYPRRGGTGTAGSAHRYGVQPPFPTSRQRGTPFPGHARPAPGHRPAPHRRRTRGNRRSQGRRPVRYRCGGADPGLETVSGVPSPLTGLLPDIFSDR